VCALNGSAEAARPKNAKLTDRLLSQKYLNLICLITVIVLPAAWALLTFDKLAPASEGWYVVYSKMILDGQMPYRDFELAFPPLYAYMMTFVVYVFGESLLAFRVIGVLLFVGLAVLSYHIFKLIFPPWIAVIATLVAVFILQSENSFIGYDYIRFYDLFNYLAFFLLLRAIVRSYRKEPVDMGMHMFFGGIFCALAALLRQTSGIIVFAYFTLFLVLVFFFLKNIELKRRGISLFLIGCSVPVLITFIWLVLTGTLEPFIQMTFLSGTKGSLSSMLFNWIHRLTIRDNIILNLTFILALCFLIQFVRKWHDAPPADNKRGYLICYAFAALTAASVFVLFFSPDLSSRVTTYHRDLLTPVFVLNTFICLVLLTKIVIKTVRKEHISFLEITYVFFSGFIFAVGFGSGTSAALSLGQGALNFGFIAAVVLGEIDKISKRIIRVPLKVPVTALIFLLLVAVPISVKVVTPYHWWGLVTEKYSDADFGTDISYFNGIRLTADEKFVYEDFTEKAGLYLADDDEIYCFSQIGIFYVLAGKVPTVKAPIPWFDVSRDVTLLEDLEYMKNNNPRMIAFADCGIEVIKAHEDGFREGNESGHRRMYEWLTECRDDPGNGYTVVETYSLQNYSIYLMVRI